MTRHEFLPATKLNVLAGAWLQFMIRDWFSHGKSEKENPWKVDVAEDDPWTQERPMQILRTRKDPTHLPEDPSPPTYLNTETHWWDGSQLYGSNADASAEHLLARLLSAVRRGPGTGETSTLFRGHHPDGRGFGRSRKGASHTRPYSGAPRLLVARTTDPLRRRRHRHISGVRGRLASLQPEPDTAADLHTSHG